MEKIYMEENRNQKQKQQKDQKRLYNISIVLSFTVAAFAIISLLTVAFDKPSYAATVTESNEFTFHIRDFGVDGFHVGDTNTGTFFVPLYYAGEGYDNPVYCVEKGNPPDDNILYHKTSVIDDYGLLYILNNSSANVDNPKKITETSKTNPGNEYLEAWATQVAIWLYLHDKYKDDPTQSELHKLTEEDLNNIQNTNAVKVTSPDITQADIWSDTDENLYSEITSLVTAAKNATNNTTLTLSQTGEVAESTDGSFYQSPLISVNSDSLMSYDIELSGIEGLTVVNENGEEMGLTGIAPATKFYVRIPSDKVTTEKQVVNVNVTGKFSTLEGSYYEDTTGVGRQKVVTVTGKTLTRPATTAFEVIGTEDTGVNKAQAIYFIGLVVLLCGIGIIYANAKRPVEVQQ